MNIQLRTTKDRLVNIELDADLQSHFADQNNCTDIIVKQINEERIYDHIFEGEDELTIIDIGANIGLFSTHVQDSAKKIYAIEPTPNHFTKLCKVTESFKDTVVPLNYAIGDYNGTMNFYVSKINPTQNSLISNWRSADEEKIVVETRTLKSLLDEQNIDHVDLIKCDIEGGEIVALTEQTVSEVKDQVECWYIEVHQTDKNIPHGDSVRNNLAHLIEVFTKNGYGTQQIGFDNLWCWKEE
jgi:FkbM family methyltransferase